MSKSPPSLLAKARQIAAAAHRGQVDKSGQDYILHPNRVSAMGKSEAEQIVGLLHDVVEDTVVTLQELSEAGFPQEIADAIDCLTEREGEEYMHYLDRVKGNALAMSWALGQMA